MISWARYWKVGMIRNSYFCCCYYYTTVIQIHILQEDLWADLEVWKQDSFWGFPCFLTLLGVCWMTSKGCFSRRCSWHDSWGMNSTLRSRSPSPKLREEVWTALRHGVQVWVVGMVQVSQLLLIGGCRGHGLQEPFHNGICEVSPFTSATGKLLQQGTGLTLATMSAEGQRTS